MELIKDIFVNLLSDAIWAVGGFMIAQLLFFKKSILLRFTQQPFFKKNSPCPVYRDNSKKNPSSTLFNTSGINKILFTPSDDIFGSLRREFQLPSACTFLLMMDIYVLQKPVQRSGHSLV